MTRHRTRFAPSPTGFLHLGHVASALHARRHAGRDGQFLIRIEDIDAQRCLTSYRDALMEDLGWLGFVSAEPVLCQSGHLPRYRQGLEQLKRRGLLYACNCTRTEIADAATRHAPDGSLVYPGTCRHKTLHSGRAPVWRLDMHRALEETGAVPGWNESGHGFVTGHAERFGDVVLGRRDSGVSYHLCVVMDDALQNIDLVTRGMDLYHATSVHRVLQELLGYPALAYAHHPLIMAQDGRKLSKRDGAEGIRMLRRRGLSPRDVLRMAEAALIPPDKSGDR